MWARRASPPGSENSRRRREPYLASATCQPAWLKKLLRRMAAMSGITRSRLWRLRSTTIVKLPSPWVTGSAMASQTLPSSSSASPTVAMNRAGGDGSKWASV